MVKVVSKSSLASDVCKLGKAMAVVVVAVVVGGYLVQKLADSTLDDLT